MVIVKISNLPLSAEYNDNKIVVRIKVIMKKDDDDNDDENDSENDIRDFKIQRRDGNENVA